MWKTALFACLHSTKTTEDLIVILRKIFVSNTGKLLLPCLLFFFQNCKAISTYRAEAVIDTPPTENRPPRTLPPAGIVGEYTTPGATPNAPLIATDISVGNTADPFHNELPIARWSSVSFQHYSDRFPIGVVAIHGSGQALGNEGIDRVDFIANNGQATTVREPSPNPKTGLWEYWTYLEPLQADGIVEVRAVVYPHSGKTRVLQGGFVESLEHGGLNMPDNQQSLVLWSNKLGTYTRPNMWVSMTGSDDTGDGTQAKPFRSIGGAVMIGYEGHSDKVGPANFGRIYLSKGTYPMHNLTYGKYLLNKGWLTIEAAPGEKREDVIVGGNNDEGASTRYRAIHFRNVTFDFRTPSTRVISSPSIFQMTHLWLEGVSIRGIDSTSGAGYCLSGAATMAITASDTYRVKWSHFNSGPRSPLIIGVDVSNCSADVFTASSLVRDWTVSDTIMNPGDHPDLWQSFGSHPNRMLMDGKIIGQDIQLIFLDASKYSNTDVAMVNIVMSARGGGVGQIGAELQNVLLWNIELLGQPLSISQFVGAAPTFGMFGSIISNFGYAPDQKPETYQWIYNQFATGSTAGTYATLLDHEADTNFVTQKTVEIPKRTVRWDLDQRERLAPYRTGAYASP